MGGGGLVEVDPESCSLSTGAHAAGWACPHRKRALGDEDNINIYGNININNVFTAVNKYTNLNKLFVFFDSLD